MNNPGSENEDTAHQQAEYSIIISNHDEGFVDNVYEPG